MPLCRVGIVDHAGSVLLESFVFVHPLNIVDWLTDSTYPPRARTHTHTGVLVVVSVQSAVGYPHRTASACIRDEALTSG
jgi:hypothetical protein